MPQRHLMLAVLTLMAIVAVSACESTAEAEADLRGAYTVDADEAVAMIDGGDRVVIDVRTPAEYEEARVVGARNISVEAADFAERIAELDPEQPYLVYCRTGNRSAVAAAQMAEAGFADVADAGGLADLARAGAPVE